MTLFVAFCSVLVGFLSGATSVGGILLIPAIQYSTGLPLPIVTGTVLCSFAFSCAFGSWVHWRNGNLDRSLVLPMSLGAVVFGCLGALAKYIVGEVAINNVLALIIIFSGLAALRPPRSMMCMGDGKQRFHAFVLVGAVVAFMAGLTGMGGGVLSVPITVVMGVSPLAAVAAAQPFQTIACISGSVGNVILDQIIWSMAIISAVLQSAGFFVGAWLAKRMDTSNLKKSIAFICILTGCYMIL